MDPAICHKSHPITKVNNPDGLCEYVFNSYTCAMCMRYIYVCAVCKSKFCSFVESHGHLMTHHDGNHYLRNKVYNYTYLIEKYKFPGLEYLRYLYAPFENANRRITYLSADNHEKYDIVKLSYMRDYFCIFCGTTFDCLPTKELVNNHLRGCKKITK